MQIIAIWDVICDSIISERPTLRVLDYLPVSDWYGLGLQLKIDLNQLDTISHTCKSDFKECKRRMFQMWLCMASRATYSGLAEALHNIGESSVIATLPMQGKHNMMSCEPYKSNASSVSSNTEYQTL